MISPEPILEITDVPSFCLGDKVTATKHKQSYTGTITEIVPTAYGYCYRIDNYRVLYAAAEIKLAKPYDAPIYYQKASTRPVEKISGIRI